jgi:hypothetical protein
MQLVPGMVIRTMFWADSARGGKPTDKGKGVTCTAECDVIKAFSLIEVELVCKVLLLMSRCPRYRIGVHFVPVDLPKLIDWTPSH